MPYFSDNSQSELKIRHQVITADQVVVCSYIEPFKVRQVRQWVFTHSELPAIKNKLEIWKVGELNVTEKH